MTTARKHPGEDLLWDFHRGALPPGLALTVRVHAHMCAHCRDELRLMDRIGGAMMERVDAVPMEASALELALARIERPEPEATPVLRKRPRFLDAMTLPSVLKDVDFRDRYHAAPGVWMVPIAVEGASKRSRTYLMGVKAGMTMPPHAHQGREITVVLTGRFSDVNGTYEPGDFVCNADDDVHAPAIAADEDCICLIAQEAPIRPQDWLGKLLQPLARI